MLLIGPIIHCNDRCLNKGPRSDIFHSRIKFFNLRDKNNGSQERRGILLMVEEIDYYNKMIEIASKIDTMTNRVCQKALPIINVIKRLRSKL